MKKFLNLFASLVVLAFTGLLLSTVSGISINLIIPVLFILAMMPKAQGVLFSALDITALNTALGAYFRKDKGVLISEMLLGMNLEDRMEIWDDCKDEVPLPNLGIDDLVKPANDTTFSGTASSLNFDARILKVRKWKVDLLIIPGDLEKSWLGAYMKKGSNAYDIPFEQYIMNHIIAKVHENLRLKAIFKGVYNGAGTAPADIMNGLLKLIVDEITATTITPVVTGAITAANVIDKVELVYDALGEAYKAVPTQMLVNPTIFDYYVRRYRSTYGVNMDYKGMANGEVNIDGSLCTIKREPGFGASQRMVCTPKSNIVYGVDSLGEENNIKTQEFERTIKLMIDAKSGIQLKEVHARALAVNDQV